MALVSRGILLLNYTGCRSGKEYSTPLSYVQENDDFLIVALRRRTWWKNFQNQRAGFHPFERTKIVRSRSGDYPTS